MRDFKTILITGASSGIGNALALRYAAPGVTLLLTGRDQVRLEQTAAECARRGAATHSAAIDLRDAAAVKAQLESWDDMTPIDLVIANAGISGGSGKRTEDTGDLAREIIEINLIGTLNTLHPLMPRMILRRHGQIALMSSMAGWRGMPNAPAYSAAKVAVRAYGEALRPLLATSNVGLSVIFPGFVKTPLTDANAFPMPFMIPPEKAAAYIQDGLSRNKARIAFPWPMLLISRLVAFLPLALGDRILMKAPGKNA